MQVLWSRTVQAKLSCQCYSCVHSATALARRSTTAATKRRVAAGDLFTASFSTILGTAAFVDARIKEDRRKEWDVAITNVKAGIPDNDSSPPTQPNLKAESITANTRIQDIRPPAGDNGVSLGKSETFSSASSLFHRNAPNVPCIPSGMASSGLDTLEGVISESNEVSAGVRRPIGPKKFAPRYSRRKDHLGQLQNSTRKLVDNLLLLTDLAYVERTAISSEDKELAEVASRLQGIRTSFAPFPTFYRHQSSERLGELHDALKRVFDEESSSPPNLNMLVGKICYNLLLSPVPPGTGTYNYLMRKFSLLQQDHLTQVVADSFFNDTVLKANEETAKFLLEYYIERNDLDGFRTIIKRMRAVEGDMHIKRKNIFELSRSKDIRAWALNNKVIHRGAHLHEKMNRTPAIFELLIRGWLMWDGTRGAVRAVRAALREGQIIYSQTMIHIIEECIRQLDYRSGLKLLSTVLSCWADGTLSSIMDYGPATRQKLYRLFALCGVNPSSNLPRPMTTTPFQEILPSMLRWMELESISDRLVEFTNDTLTIRLALDGPQHLMATGFKDQRQADKFAEQRLQSCLEILRGVSATEEMAASMNLKNSAECQSIRASAIKIRLADKTSRAAAVEVSVSSNRNYNRNTTKPESKYAFRRMRVPDSNESGMKIQSALEESVSSNRNYNRIISKPEPKYTFRRIRVTNSNASGMQIQLALFPDKFQHAQLQTALQLS
ncbi:uncharacterized protein BP5553_04762 [Venustampulla echinocandica]|uniref:Uncharacterized protein n=1 Tax=Venustampulla echinocandica TaxID=2656787 RepID=A0A370TP72_9HELO|nr:uncharacterized protein BP5553_04762 [Venustampulla echinocandica]RDL37329.1 hypothetical protein BP5553_04762 [Venustampulla echinocandica]